MFAARIQRVRSLAAFGLLAAASLVAAGCTASQKTASRFDYPVAPRSDQVDDYNGVKVADPFRPLENPDAPETREWIEKENKITFGYLNSIPEREAIKKRLTELWDYEKFGVPHVNGDYFYFRRNDGLQNQDVLYTMRGINGTQQVLLDPNTFSEDGTVALAGYAPSDDNTYLAYGVAKAGSDWNEWFVKIIRSGRQLDDHLKWIKFSSVTSRSR